MFNFFKPKEVERKRGCWLTKEGKNIPYGELTNKHLINISKMLDKRFLDILANIKVISDEMRKRGLEVELPNEKDVEFWDDSEFWNEEPH